MDLIHTKEWSDDLNKMVVRTKVCNKHSSVTTLNFFFISSTLSHYNTVRKYGKEEAGTGEHKLQINKQQNENKMAVPYGDCSKLKHNKTSPVN